jgi:hypothetical protein
MNHPFEVLQPHWGPHGVPLPPPPLRPRHTAHPYQGARTKRAFATQRQLDIDGVGRTPFALPHANLSPEEVRNYPNLSPTSSIADARL